MKRTHDHSYARNFATGGAISAAIAASHIPGLLRVDEHPEVAPLDAPQFIPTGVLYSLRVGPADPFLTYAARP